jgi:hypothetical protein
MTNNTLVERVREVMEELNIDMASCAVTDDAINTKQFYVLLEDAEKLGQDFMMRLLDTLIAQVTTMSESINIETVEQTRDDFKKNTGKFGGVCMVLKEIKEVRDSLSLTKTKE